MPDERGLLRRPAPRGTRPAPDVATATPGTPETALVRALGVRGLAAHIVNITVGGGIFALPAIVAAQLGAAAPAAYLVCALAMALIVLCFAEAGSRVALTGGPYAYVGVVFGPFIGFLTGVLLWLVGTFATASVANLFAASIGELVPPLGSQLGRAGILVVLFGVLAAVNIRGVRQGARLVELATLAKLVPLLLFVVVGAFFVHARALAWASVPPARSVASACIVLIFAFAGVESALVPGGEVRDPATTVPRALAAAMIAITILYVAVQLVAQGILGPGLASVSVAPLADAARLTGLRGGATLILVGMIISTFGYVSGMTLSVPRALFAFGRDQILATRLAAVHPRYRTPHVAITVQVLLTAALAIASSFVQLVTFADVSVLLLYFLCCVATLELRRLGIAQGGTPFRVPGGRAIPIAACAVILWLLWHAPGREFLVVGAALVAAALIFHTSPARRGAGAPSQP